MSKETRVKPREFVKIEWIKSPFHKAGTTSLVHPVQADKFIERKMAKKA